MACACVFLVRHVRKLKSVQKLAERSKAAAWAVSLTPLVVAAAFLAIDVINTAIVLIHLMAIWAACDLLGFCANKVRGTSLAQQPRYMAGALALVLTAAYMCVGYVAAHDVKATNYALTSQKAVNLRILQISDAHVGATFDGEGFARYLQQAQECNPDVVVVTGDLVDDDTSRADMLAAAQVLGQMKSTYGTFYVYGNHDKGYYNSREYTPQELADALRSSGVTILEDAAVPLGSDVVLVGRQDKSARQRATMAQLMEGVDASKYVVVLDHQPSDYAAEEKAGVDLVLCGHTHGGQMPPVGLVGELLGMNDATYGLERRGNTDFIVNAGIGDWAIQFKIGAVAEYGVIDVRG